jgi:hypothetical protein
MRIRLSFRVKDYLGQTLSVAQVDEYQIAVVAIGMDPSCQRNFLSGVIKPELATIMCSLKHRKIFLKRR